MKCDVTDRRYTRDYASSRYLRQRRWTASQIAEAASSAPDTGPHPTGDFLEPGGVVPGARVLDLFAGTGALGIEALSRGAASATFVEENREAVLCIKDNLSHCRLQGDVRQADVFAFLQKPPVEQYDMIFADPPYKKTLGNLDEDPILRAMIPFIRPNGLFVWEHYAGQRLQSAQQWGLMRRRDYGETGLTFLRFLHKN